MTSYVHTFFHKSSCAAVDPLTVVTMASITLLKNSSFTHPSVAHTTRGRISTVRSKRTTDHKASRWKHWIEKPLSVLSGAQWHHRWDRPLQPRGPHATACAFYATEPSQAVAPDRKILLPIKKNTCDKKTLKKYWRDWQNKYFRDCSLIL